MKTFEYRMMVASTVAAGLVSAHGVDHGGVSPEVIAERAIAIGDAILDRLEAEQRAAHAAFRNLMDCQVQLIPTVVDAPASDATSGDGAGATAGDTTPTS